MIIRLTILETVALLGLVTLFLSIIERSIYVNTYYWLLLIPTLIMIAYIFQNFPTKQKVAKQIEMNILNPLRFKTII